LLLVKTSITLSIVIYDGLRFENISMITVLNVLTAFSSDKNSFALTLDDIIWLTWYEYSI